MKTETRNRFQLEAVWDQNFNGFDGRFLSRELQRVSDLWAELVFDGEAIYLLPAEGRSDELWRLFADPRQEDEDDSPPEGATIFPNELDWEEIDGQTYLRAWWD